MPEALRRPFPSRPHGAGGKHVHRGAGTFPFGGHHGGHLLARGGGSRQPHAARAVEVHRRAELPHEPRVLGEPLVAAAPALVEEVAGDGRPLELEIRDAREETGPADSRVAPLEEERRLGDDLDERERGQGLSPFRPPTAGADERPVGGLGWHLVKQVVEELDYRYDPTYGNTVTLIKRLAPRTGQGGLHSGSHA